MRIRADLLVRLVHQALELRLRDATVLDLHLHGEAEAAAVARADSHRAGDFRFGGVALFLLADEIERAAEAGGVAGGKEMLRRRLARLAGAAELLRHRQIRFNDAVAGFRMTIAAADSGCGRGVERLDLVHRGILSLDRDAAVRI